MSENAALLQEVAEETFDKVFEAFKTGVDQGKEGDNLKMIMIGAGATFSNVGRLFEKYMIDAGLAMEKDNKDALVTEVAEKHDISVESGFNAAVAEIIERGTGVNDRMAASLVRHLAKRDNISSYKPVTEKTKSQFLPIFYATLLENPRMTEEELRAIIAAQPEKDQTNPIRWFSRHDNIRKMVNNIIEKHCS